MALTYKESQLVRASVPVLREHGEAVSRLCYSNLLTAHPELNNLFNPANQRNGRQPRAFTAVILAFASHINHTSELVPRLERMCNKHCSLGVRPEHYDLVGKFLLKAFAQVLGDAWNQPLYAAWAKAYSMLAKMLTAREGQMYAEFGAWKGWRDFRVERKVLEAEGVSSLYLKPCDGGQLPPYLPGQYVSLRIAVPSTGTHQLRQYSLSDRPGRDYYRITVRRVKAGKVSAAGAVSTILDQKQAGDVLQLSHPTGDFFLDEEESSTPLVLISAGIGATPLMPILSTVRQRSISRPVSWIHCSPRKAPFEDEVRRLAASSRGSLRVKFFRSQASMLEDDRPELYDRGRMDIASMGLEKLHLDHGGAEYYICGPELLMEDVARFLYAQGVEKTRVKCELFTTGDLEFKTRALALKMEKYPKIDIRSPAGVSIIYKDVSSLDPALEEIRVLHLHGGPEDSPLECTLHKVALKSDPPPVYEALSYTWGDASDTREIVLNGHVVSVTANLFLALRRLRLEDDVRVMWVDAVCINQLDLDERSQQVSLMRKIYSLCDEAAIWLGEPPEQAVPTYAMHWFGDERDDESIEWLWDRFYDYATDPDLDNMDGDSVDWIFHGLANLRLLDSGHLSEQPLFADHTGDDFAYPLGYSGYCESITEALGPFFGSPWWTRVWTVQESTLPSKATLIYGPVSIDLRFLIRAFSTLSRHMLYDCCSEYFSRSDAKTRLWLRNLGSELRNIEIAREGQQDGTETGLWETLLRFRLRNATDDRDKVFGVLGLIGSWPGKPVVPDYRATPDAVYRQVSTSVALESESLLPLHYPLRKHNHTGIPSWTMDWTAASGLGSKLNTYHFTQDLFRLFPKSEKHPCHIVPVGDGSILEVKGRRCDKIVAVGEAVPEVFAKGKRDVYCSWFKMARLHDDPSRPYKTGCSYFEAFSRCLSWDVVMTITEDGQAIHNRSKEGEAYKAYVSYCGASPKSIFHHEGLSKEDRQAVLALDASLSFADDHKWGHYSPSSFCTEQLINGLSVNMAMFITEAGYLGVGPADTRVGDEVWCLFGGWMPFVLRPSGEAQDSTPGEDGAVSRSVLGICYVHGIMDGEVADNDEIPIQTLHLV
ncbi:hypothetical protein S40288_09533 [Stachybotrys chartarum IBT 40288]|nr:hypothetical protein S40288_09533 [Stachybotrys chartarum IBT 40288]